MLQIGRGPAQSGRGGRRGFVFATDPAFITDAVEEGEQEGIIDFPRARLVAARVVGQLQVGDHRQVLPDGFGQFALHALHVIDVVLHEDIGGTRRGDDVERLPGVIEEEARNVESVDRLDQQLTVLIMLKKYSK